MRKLLVLKTTTNRAFLVTILILVFFANIALSADVDPTIYMDDFPAPYLYVVKTDGVNFWGVRYDGELLWSDTNSTDTLQSALNQTATDGGGICFVTRGVYSATVTVYSDVLMVMELGVSGVTYSTDGTGGAIYYSGGYAIHDLDLNMTDNTIKDGIFAGQFYSGTTFPASPSEADFFYRTSDHTFYVYNSTDWVSTVGSPTQHDTHQDYEYTVYVDGSTYYLKNGTTEQNDASSSDYSTVMNWAYGNLSNGGTIHQKAGTYIAESTITPKNRVELEGEGYGTYIFCHADLDDNLFENTGSPLYYATFRNFRIHGNGAQQSAGNLFDLYKPRKCVFEYLHIYDAYNDVFHFTGEAGDYGYQNSIQHNLEYSDQGGSFIFFSRTDENTIFNNLIVNHDAYAIDEDAGTGLNRYIQNGFVNNNEACIHVRGDGDVIAGNTWDNNYKEAIFIEWSSSEGISITGNCFQQSSYGSSTYSHIRIVDAGFITATGNILYDIETGNGLPAYAFHLTNVHDSSFIGNTIQGVTTDYFYQSGCSGLDIAHNPQG